MLKIDPLSATEEECWRALIRIVLPLPRRPDSDLMRVAGITANEYTTLMCLSEAPRRELRMADLANAAALSASRMTRLVDDLQSRELVTKRVSAEDGRGNIAKLTAAGEAEEGVGGPPRHRPGPRVRSCRSRKRDEGGAGAVGNRRSSRGDSPSGACQFPLSSRDVRTSWRRYRFDPSRTGVRIGHGECIRGYRRISCLPTQVERRNVGLVADHWRGPERLCPLAEESQITASRAAGDTSSMPDYAPVPATICADRWTGWRGQGNGEQGDASGLFTHHTDHASAAKLFSDEVVRIGTRTLAGCSFATTTRPATSITARRSTRDWSK
jgi:DNA-binding MarR family transcriptional regulator